MISYYSIPGRGTKFPGKREVNFSPKSRDSNPKWNTIVTYGKMVARKIGRGKTNHPHHG